MKLIFDDNTICENQAIIENFRELYENGFPDENEREVYGDILSRVRGSENKAEPHSVMILSTVDGAEDIVDGGLIVDWYENSKALHAIYAIVDENRRSKGLGKRLINEGIKNIIDWIKVEKKVEIKNVFFESNNPLKTVSDNFDMVLRLQIFSHLGAKQINIPYIQPPLDETKQEVDNLFLLSFIQFNESGDKIPAEDIKSFLADLYRSLGKDVNDNSYVKMACRLDDIIDADGYVKLTPIFETERIDYCFTKSSVTYHFSENINNENDCQKDCCNIKQCDDFTSFETDLFNYQNQEAKPYSTAFHEYLSGVTLVFPKFYSYVSEGKTHTVFTSKNRVSLKANVSISFSTFKKPRKRIIHVTFEPIEGECFTELDLIKLAEQFGSKQERVLHDGELMVKLGNGQCLSVTQLLNMYCNHEAKYEGLNNGIIQIELTKNIREQNEIEESKRIDFGQFFKEFTEKDSYPLDSNTNKFAKTICGIILGIFDFRRMSKEEIFDTIIATVVNDTSFIVACRGAVVRISMGEEDETDNLDEDIDDNDDDGIPGHIIVLPYVLIPNVLLAHNECALSEAVTLLNDSMNFKEIKYSVITRRHRKKEWKLRELETNLARVREILNTEYLTDVFQYPSEIDIIERGNKERGISTFINIIEKRIKELSEKIKNIRADRSNRAEAWHSAILATIAITQLYTPLKGYITTAYDSIIFYLSCLMLGVIVFIIVRKRVSKPYEK